MKFFLVSTIGLLFTWQSLSACTIGVAAGRATPDGRPLVWKTRDNSAERDNELVYNTSFKIPFLEITNAGGTSAWMGLNRSGFAILNTVCEDLPVTGSGLSNGVLMRNALGSCNTLAEFETFLQNNDHGNTHGNFGAIDSTGAAAIFEISGTSYWKYDATDSATAPYGYVIRTNFAANGDGVNGSGYDRFQRSADLMYDFYRGDSLSYKSILRYQMRDFSDSKSNPVPVPFPDRWVSYRPYGYIHTGSSICRNSSVSTVVMQGILSGEPSWLSTMWTMLGAPMSSIAVPYWPVGSTPPQANGNSTAPLCDVSLDIRSYLYDYPENSYYLDSYKLRDGQGGGIWPQIFAAEDSILTAAQQQLEQWRINGTSALELQSYQAQAAVSALDKLTDIREALATPIYEEYLEKPANFVLHKNYPNPFNPATRISYDLSQAGYIDLTVYDITGRQVQTLFAGYRTAGSHSLVWKGPANGLASGIYICRLKYVLDGQTMYRRIKMNLMK